MRLIVLSCLLMGVLLLSACGQRGPLTLPDAPSAQPGTSASH